MDDTSCVCGCLYDEHDSFGACTTIGCHCCSFEPLNTVEDWDDWEVIEDEILLD